MNSGEPGSTEGASGDGSTAADSDSASTATTATSTTGPSDSQGETTGVDPSGDGGSTSSPVSGTTSGTTMGGSTSAGNGTPLVEVSDGPTYDFAMLPVGQTVDHTFDITNTGDGAATNLGIAGLPAPFSVQGNDCPGTLDAGNACVVVVRFAPAALGPANATLHVQHDDGDAQRPLIGAGSGETANLLVNPGGETPSAPPAGWAEVDGYAWTTTTEFSHSESRSIWAGSGPTGLLALQQKVDVSAWASVIDSGGMTAHYDGYMRSWASGNDDFRLRFGFLDAADTVIDGTVQASSWDSSTSWTQHTLQNALPAGTRAVLVQLECDVPGGSQYADCWYDDLSLTLSYP